MRGTRRLRKALGRLRRRFRPAGIILMYHRVVDLRCDPLSLSVSVDHFAQHLDYLARTCQPMPLGELVAALQQGVLPQRAVAVTFDDGYGDNFVNAYPLLAAAQIPATIFVTSEPIDSRQEFWWDELERVVLAPMSFPALLRCSMRAGEFAWSLNGVEDQPRAYWALYHALKPLAPDERAAALQQLGRWANAAPADRAAYRAMTRTELAEIVNGGLVEIGGHTRNHPQLAALPVDAQRAEIVGGKRRLEELIGSPLKAFAYPYGQATDFTEETTVIVRAAGFGMALTTIHGYVETGDDIFQLRRCAVFNWDHATFRRKIEEFFVIRD